MTRVFIGSFIAAVVVFVWGAVWWAVSPLPFTVLKTHPNEAEVVAALKKGNPESGTYLYPWCNEDQAKSASEEAMKEFELRHQEGPLVQIIYRKDGVALGACPYIMGFVHNFASAFLAALLLWMVRSTLETYMARVLVVLVSGLFAPVLIDLSAPIWFHHPLPYALFQAAYHVGFVVLTALVLGAIVKKPS